MDRRQYKSREAIFSAFVSLLSEKELSKITVNEIIERADVSRATFYAHFETKDYLLKALCEELFCHIFDEAAAFEASGSADAAEHPQNHHRHIFSCDAPDSVFLHLLKHIEKNDHHITTLLSCPNNTLFLRYFHGELCRLVRHELSLFASGRNTALPEDFRIHHIASTFTETVRWWADNGMTESAETVAAYFYAVV